MIKKGMKFLRNLSILYKLLLTFLLLLVIAVSVTFSINYYNQRFISNMMIESNKQIIQGMNSELNGIYDKITQMYLTFNNQDLYKMFIEKEDMTNFQAVQEELRYKNVITNLITANNLQGYINGTILYADEKAWKYVGAGAANSDFSIETSVWYEKFQGSNTGRLIYGPLVEDFKTPNSTKYQVFYFMRSWYIPQISGVSGAENPFLLFSLDTEAFVDIFRQFGGNTKVVLVMNPEKKTLFTVNMDEDTEAEILTIVEEHEANFDEKGAWFNKQWAITRTTNENFQWVIYSAESTRDVFRDMNRLNRNIYLIILSTGGVTILLALYLTRKIIMPLSDLNRMMDKIEEKDTYLDVKNQDELGQIGERFNRMKHRIQDMAEKMYLGKMQEKEAQLRALQAQINPHFLYNTLDNIYCIAQIEGSEKITSLTENLSKMMRYSMSMKSRYVPLVQELEHVKSYVNILNVRFDDSIVLKIRVDEEAKDVEVPKLSMQPLAENAWNHGILPKTGHRGTILFKVSVDEGACIIQVVDDGIGISLEKCREINQMLERICYDTSVSNNGSGIALKNVNNRIMLEDGEGYGVRLYHQEEGGCRVIVRTKLHKREESRGSNNPPSHEIE